MFIRTTNVSASQFMVLIPRYFFFYSSMPQQVLGTRRDLAKKLCNICVRTAEPEFISSNTILAL